MAEWSCSGLQSRGRRFDSDSRLQFERSTLMQGDRIKRIRAATGLSQSKFAQWLGVSLSSLQDWEEDRYPPTKRAIKLLEVAEASAKKIKGRIGK
jgi:putative transcriptional regulator